MRLVVVAIFLGSLLGADDLTIPLDDGKILVRARFLRVNQWGDVVPELILKLKNQTSSPWRTLKLQFDVGGFCNEKFQQWTIPVFTSIGWAENREETKDQTDTAIPLVGKVNGCRAVLISARLIVAENSKLRIDGTVGERVDLEKQVRELQAKADEERRVNEAQAIEKRRALEAQAAEEQRTINAQAAKDEAHRKTIAAEQRKKQAIADAQYQKLKAEMDAKATEERRKLRAACLVIYQNTIDKKVRDLTVREEQQVRACQTMGLYPPQ